MMDESKAAETLFGGTAPQEQQPPEPSEFDRQAERLFGNPADKQQLSNSDEGDDVTADDDDRAAAMFGDTLHADTALIPLDSEGADPEQLAQANEVFRAELLNVGVMNPKVGTELADILQDAYHAPLSDEELAAEKTQTAGELVHVHGEQGARERIELAKGVLGKSEMLRNAVDVLELGNSFDLINVLADVGRDLQKRGKLK